MQQNQLQRATKNEKFYKVRLFLFFFFQNFLSLVLFCRASELIQYQGTLVDVFFATNEFPVVHHQRKSTETEFLSYMGGTLGKIMFLVGNSLNLRILQVFLLDFLL